MHELSITQAIVNTALQRGREVGAKRIAAVRVKVGEFTAVEPDCLQSYFGILTDGTMAENAALVIEMVELAAACRACGSPFAPDRFRFRCPDCGSPEVEITGGRELYVESIEVQ